jgi:lipopolysaccharide assembly outer membrane protein LptD (OstA)
VTKHLTTSLFTFLLAISVYAQKDAKATSDSLSRDSLVLGLPASPDALDEEVIYSAEDSMRFDLAEKKIYLYGKADVKYDKIHLQAAYIEINWSTNVIHAEGRPDSTGKMSGTPQFSEGEQTFDASKMDYNFKTKKGKISEIYTKQGEGYLLGNAVKKMENESFFVKNGKFTTCNLPEHPHFYINASKVKVIPNDKIVTGPANLVIEEIPTPLVVPFGIFPNTSSRKSGILFPTYGDSPGLGFFLMDGGYYWGISDHFDASLRGDIYSRGSWGLKGGTNYNYRYRFNGNLDLRYAKILQGDPELLGSSVIKSFFVTWRHNQDAKSRPNSRFSANVNAGSSDYNQLNSFNTNNIVANTFQSAITWTKTFNRLPLNLNVSAGHSQNTQTRIITVNAPEIQLNVNRIFPFRRKNPVGAQRFYEKIGITGTLQSKNTISQPDSVYMQPGLAKKFNNGMQFQLPIATSFQLLKYFNVSPSFNVLGRGYFSNIQKRYDADLQEVVTDTIRKFSQLWEYNAAVNVSTRVYSFLKLGKNTVRHVATAQFGFRYQPDFSTVEYGYYGPNGTISSYSPYEQGIYGQPSRGKQGTVTLGVNNNVEAKVRSRKDTTGSGLRKIVLFDAVNFNTGYNLAVDSFNLQALSVNARTRIAKIDVVYSSNWDWYAYDTLIGKRLNQLEYDVSGKWLRPLNTSLALNTTLASGAKKKDQSKSKRELDTELSKNPNAYIDFSVPWNLNAGLIFGQNQATGTPVRNAIVNFSGDVSITEKWKVSFSSGYDFVQKEISFTSIDIYRDLHCWEMRFNWIPFGFRQSYNFSINVKSGMLQDLKLNRRRQWFDLENE